MRRLRHTLGLVLVGLLAILPQARAAGEQASSGPNTLSLRTAQLQLDWQRGDGGWALDNIRALGDEGWRTLPHPLGEYGVVWSATAPNLEAVQQDRAGTSLRFLPDTARRLPNGALEFRHETEYGSMSAVWAADPAYPTDVKVTLHWVAKRAGFISLASPTVAGVERDELEWGMVPGQWYGADTNPDYNLASKYGQGLPASPAVKFEHTTTTLSPLIETTSGVTMAAVPEPGSGRDPYPKDKVAHRDWRLGLSTMDRERRLTPQLYSPVLGGTGSWREVGQAHDFSFRYSIQAADWFDVYKHVIYDVYSFSKAIELKDTAESLSARQGRIQQYLENPVTSQWRTDEFEGKTIGAQDYLGLVTEADGDAMKNSDIGAMWMTARAFDSRVTECERLEYVRNFKLAQQRTDPGFFQASPVGQYYLHKSNRFVEEFGPYVEPLGLTYYTVIDMANILNFDPADEELRGRLRLGADKLVDWQKADGSWDVAYNREPPHALSFPNLVDYRPTWYGLLVAYQQLGDRKYLDAARKGADWFIKHGVANGYYLGSTGDSGFLMDLSVSQSAQGLLDLERATGHRPYRDAAIEVAKLYTTWVYTHPIVSDAPKTRDGKTLRDWEITQVGLQKEQNATASTEGPILLNSHVATLLRFYQLTGEHLFRDMARAGALGRDAFTDPGTGVQSYYWQKFDEGPGPFPHHGWWQIGWITDYLLTEAQVRTKGAVSIPPGPFTPKVGGQVSYGHQAGKVFGIPARLHNPPGMLTTDDPRVDVLGFDEVSGNRTVAVALNNSAAARKTTITLDPAKVELGRAGTVTGVRAVHGGKAERVGNGAAVTIPPWGTAVVAFDVALGEGQFTDARIGGTPDTPSVTWGFPGASRGAVDFRVQGDSTWTRNAATSVCQGFTAKLGPVQTLPETIEYRLVAIGPSGTEQTSTTRTIRLYDPANPGENLAAGATATATSSLRPDTGPEKAVDGNPTDPASRWLSADGDRPPRLEVDLGSVAELYLIRLHSGFAEAKDTVASFTVEASVNGAWTEVGRVDANRERVVDLAIPGGVQTNRFRLTFTDPSSTTPDIARVFEVEAYGKK